MAFDVSSLERELKDVFANMQDDNDFANGIASACKTFGESGSVTTTDVGAISSGSFTGAGTGAISLDDSLLSNPISVACETMKSTSGGDAILANAIGTGLLAMSTAGKVETDVTGTAISPAGVPIPTTGKAQGTIVCQNASVISTLNSCFADMKDKAGEEGFNGDEHFAQQLASAVKDFFTTGVITTQGQGSIAGSVGTGTVS